MPSKPRPPMEDVPRNVVIKEHAKPHKKRSSPSTELGDSAPSPVSVTSTDDSSVTEHSTGYEEQEDNDDHHNTDDHHDPITVHNTSTHSPTSSPKSSSSSSSSSPVPPPTSPRSVSSSKKDTMTTTANDSLSAKELLQIANLRVKNQELKQTLVHLHQVIDHKDEQLGQLSAQLRRAIGSKCDLVVACTDLEKQLAVMTEQMTTMTSRTTTTDTITDTIDVAVADATNTTSFAKEQSKEVPPNNVAELVLQQKYLDAVEARAAMEREFMNELNVLTNQLIQMDTRYKNELCERDFLIGQLQEKNRRLVEEMEAMHVQQRLRDRTQEVRSRIRQQSSATST